MEGLRSFGSLLELRCSQNQLGIEEFSVKFVGGKLRIDCQLKPLEILPLEVLFRLLIEG